MRDLGSRAGTVVNGAVTTNVLLQHGDRIAVGDSAFLYLAEASEPPPPAVELYDQAFADESTVQLPPQEALAGDPEKVLEIPASDHLAHELGTLLHVAARIGSVPDVESLQWQLLGPIFDLVPGRAWRHPDLRQHSGRDLVGRCLGPGVRAGAAPPTPMS